MNELPNTPPPRFKKWLHITPVQIETMALGERRLSLPPLPFSPLGQLHGAILNYKHPTGKVLLSGPNHVGAP